jgi:transcriptional regulator with XRE-family HTH domain
MTVPTFAALDGLQREEILKKLGGNIRRERVMRFMSQDWIAAKAGLNVYTIAKIEAGELNVRSQTIERIRAAIGCPLSRLLGMTPEAGENELRVAIAQLQFLKKLCAPDVTSPRQRRLCGTNNIATIKTKKHEPK